MGWDECEGDDEVVGTKQEVDSLDKVMHERFVIFKEENEGGREMVTTDEERMQRARRLHRDKLIQIARLSSSSSSSENFVRNVH